MVSVTIPPDTSPQAVEQLEAVHRLVEAYRAYIVERYGTVPALWSEEWWTATPAAQLAGVLVLSEAWLVLDPERMAAERLREMSHDLAAALDWSREAGVPSMVELRRRRAERITPVYCTHSSCREVISVQHPLPPDLGTVRCKRHQRPEGAAA